jgi:uncharacterized protein YeaO (DUF488 family)
VRWNKEDKIHIKKISFFLIKICKGCQESDDKMIKIKRAYQPADEKDGFRILVDRLWPRGISKVKAKLDLWMKDIAPSNSLRQWFNHDPIRWDDFQSKYNEELKDKKEFLKQIKDLEKDKSTITLVYGAKDEEHNNAVVLSNVLKDYIESE